MWKKHPVGICCLWPVVEHSDSMTTSPCLYMWQSRVEIEGYSVSHISIASLPSKRHITELQCSHALCRFICIYETHMSSALHGSSAIRRFKHSNVIKICDGITFNFYTWLPHIYMKTIIFMDVKKASSWHLLPVTCTPLRQCKGIFSNTLGLLHHISSVGQLTKECYLAGFLES